METARQYLQTIAELFGPNLYLQAAVIAVVSIGIAKLGEVVLTRVIGRVARHSATVIDDHLLQLIRRPLFFTFVVFGLSIATQRLQLPDNVQGFTLSALSTLAIFVWSSFGLNFCRMLITSLRDSGGRLFQARMLPLIQNTTQLVIIAVTVYFLFVAWDVDATAWVASAGIVGLALSFGARESLANLFAGASILADAPYKVGDFITLETGERGLVTHIGLRSTRLLTRDDIEITVPNGVIGAGKIVNEAGGPHEKHRIRLAVGVAYGSDIDQVMDVLMNVARGHDELCADPKPRVRFRAFGNSSLDFELLAWIERSVDRGRLRHELHCRVYKAFQEHKIEIPFPQRDVYVRQLPQ